MDLYGPGDCYEEYIGDDENFIMTAIGNEKSIYNNLKKRGIEEKICQSGDNFYKQIIKNNLLYNDKNLIYRKINLVMFEFFCCLLAYNDLGVPVMLDNLREKFDLSKGEVKKCFSLFSAIRINVEIEFNDYEPEDYYKSYIEIFNDLPPEDRKRVKRPLNSKELELVTLSKKNKKIDIDDIDDSIGDMELNDTFLEELSGFSDFVLAKSAELRTGSPNTTYAGIFYYYISAVYQITIPNDILNKITGNSYATDSKNMAIVSDVLKRFDDLE